MSAIIGLLLPGAKLLTRVPLIGVSLCALGLVIVCGLAIVVMALRLGGLVLRIVVRGSTIVVPLLVILIGAGFVPARSLPLTREAVSELAQRRTIAPYRAAITGRTPAWVLEGARQIRDYALGIPPQPLASAPQRPARSGTWVAVAHTGGEGAYLRAAPRLSTRLQAWGDGTRLEVVGEDADGDGYRWKRVCAPNGQLGWIAEEFVIPTLAP